jgi:hypothetical protein
VARAAEPFVDLAALAATKAQPMTAAEAGRAYKALLGFIAANFTGGGMALIGDFRQRFFGTAVPLRPDLNLATLLDNYTDPLSPWAGVASAGVPAAERLGT